MESSSILGGWREQVLRCLPPVFMASITVGVSNSRMLSELTCRLESRAMSAKRNSSRQVPVFLVSSYKGDRFIPAIGANVTLGFCDETDINYLMRKETGRKKKGIGVYKARPAKRSIEVGREYMNSSPRLALDLHRRASRNFLAT